MADSKVLASCDWPNEPFTFHDEPGEHDPCYVVMPGGAMLPLNHHTGEGVDIARAKFIVAACNAALSAPQADVRAALERLRQLEAYVLGNYVWAAGNGRPDFEMGLNSRLRKVEAALSAPQADVRAALERIRDFPHSGDSSAQAMVQIATQALSSPPSVALEDPEIQAIETCAKLCDAHARWAEEQIEEDAESKRSQLFALISNTANDCAAIIRDRLTRPRAGGAVAGNEGGTP